MPSPKTMRNAIYEAFLTGWGSATAVLIEDQEGVPPVANDPWVRISVQHNDGEQAALGGEAGNQFFRRFGVVFVQVFVPRGKGTNDLDDYSYTALKVFEGQAVLGAFFRNCRITSLPPDRDSKWAQANVVAEFQYDDIH